MRHFDPVSYINEPRWQESRLGLVRIRELLDRMEKPQESLRFVHVAGTNGKGSVCAFLASILQEAGLRVGLFTSPYIVEFTERIRVNGENISASELQEVTLWVREHAEAMAEETGEHPTEFELMTAIAFQHFARKACDIVVCEVGLGGRLDSTNVIEKPDMCIITRLGLDHMELLGNTLEAIAYEKAGIIKPGATVVSWPQEDPMAMNVIRNATKENNSNLIIPAFSALNVGAVTDSTRTFEYERTMFTTQLLASYQPYNAVLAIEASRALRHQGWDISECAIYHGIAHTSWPGRFQVIALPIEFSEEQQITPPVKQSKAQPRELPVFVVDGAHNSQGAEALMESLCEVFPDKPVVFVMGVLADKDYRTMIQKVASLATAFVCVTPPNPRALPAEDLAHSIHKEINSKVPIVVATDFRDAIHTACHLVNSDGIVCAFGSLYSVAAFKEAIQQYYPQSIF